MRAGLGVEGGRALRTLGWALLGLTLVGLGREGLAAWQRHLFALGDFARMGGAGALAVSQTLAALALAVGAVAALSSWNLAGDLASDGGRGRWWAVLAAVGLSLDALVDGGWMVVAFGQSLSAAWLERLSGLWMINLLAILLWSVGVLGAVRAVRRESGAPAWDGQGWLALGGWGVFAALLAWHHWAPDTAPRSGWGVAVVATLRAAPFALTGLVCLQAGRRAPRAAAWVPMTTGAGAELADFAQLLATRVGLAVVGTAAVLVARLAEVQGALRLLVWLVPAGSMVLGALMLRAALRYGRATVDGLPPPGRSAAQAAAVVLGLGLAVECYALILGLDLTGDRLGPALAAMRRLPVLEVAAAVLGPAAALCMAAVARAVGHSQGAARLVRAAGAVQVLWGLALAVAVGARLLLLQREPVVGAALAATLLALVLSVTAVLRLLRVVRAAARALPAVA